MNHTRQQVIAAVKSAFPPADCQAVLDLLDLYGIEPHERERERVQLAIVALSRGREAEVAGLVEAAKRDYRDVLLWHDQGAMPAAEGKRAQQAVREILERWGDDS